MSIDYRRFGPADVPGLRPALHELYAAMYAEEPYCVTPETMPYFDQQLDADVQAPDFALITAADGPALVGMIYGYTLAPGAWWPNVTVLPGPDILDAPTRVVKEWGLLPAHRGRGTGRHLMQTFLAGRPEPHATLNAHPDAPARKLYDRLGWQQIGQSKQDGFTPRDVLWRPLGS